MGIKQFNNKLIGRDIIYLSTVTSTSDYLKTLREEKNADEGTVVVAQEQSGGRGRAGRAWESPPGGLWFSILLLPNIEPGEMALLSMVFATSISRAINPFLKVPCQVKWPNDILLSGRKLVGVLLETNSRRELYVGIGINIEMNCKELGEPIANKAVAMKEFAAKSFSLNEVFLAVLAELEHDYQRFMAGEFKNILQEFLKNCSHVNQEITVKTGNRVVSGINTGVDLNGNLIMQTDQGEIKISTGEVEVI